MQDHPIIRSSIPEKVAAVCVSHDGLYCVAGGISGSCYIWEVCICPQKKGGGGREQSNDNILWTYLFISFREKKNEKKGKAVILFIDINGVLVKNMVCSL